jgi:hypothetical protein
MDAKFGGYTLTFKLCARKYMYVLRLKFSFPFSNCIKFGDWCKIFGLFRKFTTLLAVNIGTQSEIIIFT